MPQVGETVYDKELGHVKITEVVSLAVVRTEKHDGPIVVKNAHEDEMFCWHYKGPAKKLQC